MHRLVRRAAGCAAVWLLAAGCEPGMLWSGTQMIALDGGGRAEGILPASEETVLPEGSNSDNDSDSNSNNSNSNGSTQALPTLISWALAATTVETSQALAATADLRASSQGLAGQPVLLERSTDGSTWASVAERPTDEAGIAHFTITEAAPGTYHYRAVFDGNERYAGAQSAASQLVVTAPPPSTKIRMAVGGAVSCYSDAFLDQLKQAGIAQVHSLNSPGDMTPHAEVAARIRARGMVPVFDIEGLYWADGSGDPGWPGRIGSGAWSSFLPEVKQAGWAAIASEGMYGADCTTIQQYVPFISYGGDLGETLYDGECAVGYGGTSFCGTYKYKHPTTSHTANYVEMYNGSDPSTHYNACKVAAKYTPKNMGLTIGLWSTYRMGGPTLATNPQQLVQAIKDLRNAGVNIKTILWWVGYGACPNALLGQFNAAYQAVASAFGTEQTSFP